MRRTTGIFLILYAFVLFVAGLISPSSVSALDSGLSATVYDNWTGQYNQYNNAPPLPPTTPVCAETVYPSLDVNFDAGSVCGIYDDFVVKFEGYITAPATQSYTFYMHGDDGTRLYFGGQMVENFWRDTGNGGQTFSYSFNAGEAVPLLAWYYENGGGAWVRLDYLVNGAWTPVPSSWFTTTPPVTTTTTIAPYLNAPRNLQILSVTDSSVSLSWDAPETSNADVERYAVMWSCETNWDAGWAIAAYTTEATINGLESATSCIFQVRADNDTIPTYSGWSQSVSGVTETTTTTTSTTTSTTTTSTTTTTVPIRTTTTTVVPTTTTEVPVGTTTSVSPPETTVLQQTKQQETTTTTPETTTTTVPPTTTTVPAESEKVDAEVVALLEDASNLSKEEIQSAVNDIIDNGVNEAEAKELATNADVLQSVTAEQATEIFDAVVPSDLSEEDAQKLVEAVQDAPQEVRNAFEEQIDIFGSGKFDTYVPVGSAVNVSQRRVIVAASAGAMLAAPAATTGGTGPSGGSGGSGGPSGGDSGDDSGNKKTKRTGRRRHVRKTR